MIEFLEKYWTYIVAVGTVTAYLYDKGRNLWLEKSKKKNAYNRLFTSVTKLYFSYIKHQKLYSETALFNFPDDLYIPMLKHIDSFDEDLNNFKDSVDKESEIIPEIIIQSYSLFEGINRLRIVDKIKSDNPNEKIQITDDQKVKIKRAQFYALSEIFDDFFDEILSNIHKRSTVSKDFIDKIKYFRTDKYIEESNDNDLQILRRYYESLHRQNAIPDDLYLILKKEFNLE